MDRQMQTYLRSQSNDLSALKKQTDLQNKIQAHALKIAVDTNRELKSINETLNAMGFVMEEVAGSLQRQEKMHAEHYDAVKKEKALKEVLYNFKKFQTAASQTGDSIVGASGARILSQMVTSAGFSTKDLSDIADKEYFDKRIDEAKSLTKKLTSSDRDQLDDFEYAYGAYQYLKNYDIGTEYVFTSKLPKPPMPGQLSTFDSEDLPDLFAALELEKQVTPWKIASIVIATGVPLAIGAALQVILGLPRVPGGFLFWLPFWALAFGLWQMKVAGPNKRIKEIKNRTIPGAHRGQTAKYLASVLSPLKEYSDRIKAEKAVHNQEIAELTTGLEAKKKSFAGIINAFIQAHPGIAEFYPRVE